MSKAKTLMGHDLMLWMNGKVIAGSKSCKVGLKSSTVDSETKDDGEFDAKEIASQGCTISNDSLYSVDKNRSTDLVYRDLVKMWLNKEPVDFTYGLVANKSAAGVPEDGWIAPTEDCLKGKAMIMGLDFDATKGSKASISIKLESYGEVKLIEPKEE